MGYIFRTRGGTDLEIEHAGSRSLGDVLAVTDLVEG